MWWRNSHLSARGKSTTSAAPITRSVRWHVAFERAHFIEPALERSRGLPAVPHHAAQVRGTEGRGGVCGERDSPTSADGRCGADAPRRSASMTRGSPDRTGLLDGRTVRARNDETI
jgi:hypothetical protein